MRRQQDAVVAVEAIGIVGFAPGFDVKRGQVHLGVIEPGPKRGRR